MPLIDIENEGNRGNSVGSHPPRPRWHFLYFVLAAFDLLTICISLSLNHRLMGIHTQSVRINQQWSDRRGLLSELGQLAADVNAPGNDVFDSHDVPTDSARMEAALLRFDAAMAARRLELTNSVNIDSRDRQELLEELDGVSVAMSNMVEEAHLIFGHFKQNRAREAGERMATMDRKFAQLNKELAGVRVTIQQIQNTNFAKQTAVARSLEGYEYGIAVAILLMVGGIALYGHKLSQSISRSMRENELYLAALQKEITERKRADQARQRMEVQLRHAQKMESIGQLAAGIAHEINTPTQFIGDNTRFLRDAFTELQKLLEAQVRLMAAAQAGSVPPALLTEVEDATKIADVNYLSEEIPKALDQSLDGIERVTNIVRAMKEFSHPGTTEKTALDLNRAIESTLIVCCSEWKYVADLATNFDASLPPVPVLPGEFNQVVLNIIINATHAIADVVGDGAKGKGTISVSTRRDGGWAEIRIGDTGTGIPEKARERVFDPFFTTKQVGKGTGQGLAIAHNVIVEKHDGTITFETETDKGTTFVIRLPLKPLVAAERKAA
jgi:two-component system, NtrC family, sensor kinase